MAPGRRKGADRGKEKVQLRLGDLVLAKVKGHPAWPAKISSPGDRDISPAPRKHFVEFFGTEEIAYVAPADIQIFTDELKEKLMARCHGKPARGFARAVEEICDAFNVLQRKNEDDHVSSSPVDAQQSKGHIELPEKPDLEGQGQKLKNKESNVSSDELHKLESCFRNHDRTPSDTTGQNSSVSSVLKRRKVVNNDRSTLKEGMAPVSKTSSVNSEREENSMISDPDITIEALRKRSGSRACPEIRGSMFEVNEQMAVENGPHKKDVVHEQREDMDHLLRVQESRESGKESKDSGRKNKHGADDEIVASSGGTNELSGKVLKLSSDMESEELLKGPQTSDKYSTRKDKNQEKIDIPKKHRLDGARDERAAKRTKDADRGDSCPDGKASSPLSKQHHGGLEDASNNPCRSGTDSAEGSRAVKEGKDTTHARIRRSCRFDNDDDNEGTQRTPVHREAPAKSISTGSNLSTHSEKLDSLSGSSKGSPSRNRASVIKDADLLKDAKSHDENAERRAEKAVEKGAIDFSPNTRSRDHKSIKVEPGASASVLIKKSQVSSSKFGKTSESSNSPHNQAVPKRNVLLPKQEKSNANAKPVGRMPVVSENRSSINFSAEHDMLKDFSSLQRTVIVKEEQMELVPTDSGFLDSVKTMRHLIAAAHAKRRQVQSHCPLAENVTAQLIPGKSPSPVSSIPVVSENSPPEMKEVFISTPDYPSDSDWQAVSRNQVGKEEYKRGISPGFRTAEGPLSCGTEAAVARDALEGMIETLSRTKESIGRATRLAIECAKYGIAGEIVELLIRKLEGEHSLHRRVDLFFLVDSITQCSHSQKGIAGASYIPMVQAALPRLLGAAAPPGAGARENRRQCLKVLRLWLERKILPEPLLQRYMDDIEVSNEDVDAVFSLRHPSRVERSVDDPIREMEGMLVDEYGSNASFQFSGILSSHILEEEEDLCSGLSKVNGILLPVEPRQTPGHRYTCILTSSDRRHYIPDEADSELEMEDDSTIQKHEVDSQNYGSFTNLDVTMTGQIELPHTPEGLPPLPLHPPPPPPPLPSSPPPSPPPPPPLSPSPPPPPPPLPAPSPPPSFPPPPPTQALFYYPRVQEHCKNQNGNHGNSSQGLDNGTLSNEVVLQQANSLRPHDYGRNDVYSAATRGSQPNLQFQQSSASFYHGSFHSFPPGQSFPGPSCLPARASSNQFSHMNPVVQQTVQQTYNPYSLPSVSSSCRQHTSDEHWQMHSGNLGMDNQYNNAWASSAMGTLNSEGPFVQDGFFLSNMERPPSNSVGYQLPLNYSMPSGTSNLGHVPPQTLHIRPDISGLNCWKPV